MRCCKGAGKMRATYCNNLKCCNKNATIFKLDPTPSNISHVATRWPNVCNTLRAKILQDVSLNCCVCMLHAFGQALTRKKLRLFCKLNSEQNVYRLVGRVTDNIYWLNPRHQKIFHANREILLLDCKPLTNRLFRTKNRYVTFLLTKKWK